MCFLFGHRPFVFDVTSTIYKRWTHARNGGALRYHIDGSTDRCTAGMSIAIFVKYRSKFG